MRHSSAFIALLFFFGPALFAAEVSPSKGTVDYQQPPVAGFESGLVRVWNEKGAPPMGRDQVPEARLGDSLVAEIKNLDGWLCENLDAGAWRADLAEVAAPVRTILEDRKIGPAVLAGKWLLDYPEEPQNAGGSSGAGDDRYVKLLVALRTALGLEENALPRKDDKGAPLDASKPADARRIVEACRKALEFMRSFRERKAAEFILAINETKLPGFRVTVKESETSWRSARDRQQEASYTWWNFRLKALDDAEWEKAWSDLMRAAGSRFSLRSKVSISLPDELVSLRTAVTPTAEDSRCRFDLIALSEAPRKEKELAKGEFVYPLTVRERHNEIRQAEIVEVDPAEPASPYLVHFLKAGGTKRYSSVELARLPPDPVPIGVVRVWNAQGAAGEWEEAQRDETPMAKIGDRLVVEVRNFDGWLPNAIDQGFLRDDPLVMKVSKPLEAFIKAKDFTAAVRVGGAAYRMGNKSQRTAADIVRQMQKEAGRNRDFARLVFPTLNAPQPRKVGGPQNSPSSAALAEPASQEEEQRKQDELKAEAFLDPYREAHTLLREMIKGKLRALDLTINGIVLGVTPDNSDYTPISRSRRPPGDPDEDTYHWLSFSLAPKADGAARKAKKEGEENPFDLLMAKPSFNMPSKVTLTLKSGAETLTLPTAVTPEAKDKRCRFGLVGIEPWKFWSMLGIFLAIFGSLAFFAGSTDILRDPCRRRPEGVEPVSLARTQMAFWFAVIAAAFAFLWVTTGNIETINGTCLTLLAIGTSTALTSAAIQGKRDQKKDLSEVLQKTPHEMLKMTPRKMKEAIEARKAELAIAAPAQLSPEERAEELEILEKREQEIDCFLQGRPKWINEEFYFWRYRLRNVFEDLLTEEAGTYDLHRFQMLAWTVVLGAVFVFKVLHERIMPQFDTNVLLLMGISSGAYLGFKKVATNRADDDEEEQKKAEKKGIVRSPAS